MMKFVFILDELSSIKIDKDSSFAMMVEAASRGYRLFVIKQEDLFWKNGETFGISCSIELTGQADIGSDWYKIVEIGEAPLQEYDAVLMRKDPPVNMEYIYSTYLLELAEKQGVCIINSPQGIRNHNEKLSIAKFPQFIAPTLVTRQHSLIREFLDEYHDIILKPLDGMGGAGIFHVNDVDHNISVIIDTLTNYGDKTIMAQRYIPEISEGDKRILLVDGKPVPYALARIPKKGESRANLAAGGSGVVQPLTSRDYAIAEALGPYLHNQGLMLVGLDVIGEYLTEINVTSPTCMQEISKLTDFNIAGLMIDSIEKKIQNIR
tara:strand:+ start:1046 stop:2008 length:963 start_codon:yes stop_codon:yes gene_type:complete